MDSAKTYLDQESNSTNFFGFFQKILALSSYKNDKNYNYYLFALWIIFASILYSIITFAVKSSQTVFVLYLSVIIWAFVLTEFNDLVMSIFR